MIKLNRGQTGYYRVKYDASLRRKLIDQLLSDHTVLDELDRTGLIDDAFNLAIADEIPYSDALDMARSFLDPTSSDLFSQFPHLLPNLDLLTIFWQ